MPHLFMEYSANLSDLDTEKALLGLNHALVASGHFASEFDIKSRALPVRVFCVGVEEGERGFVHVKLAVLSGRSAAIKKQLSESLLAVLTNLGGWPVATKVQLSVEIVDLDRESYSKAVVQG